MAEENIRSVTASAPQKHSQFSSTLLPVLTAIGTGIGAIGFVIFFGGFILWTRFDAAGLPANEAVAQVPRSDLVATGASFLIPAFLAAFVAAALVLVGVDATIGRRSRNRHERRNREADDADDHLEWLLKRWEQTAEEVESAENEVKRLDQRLELEETDPAGDDARADYNAAVHLREDRRRWIYTARTELIPKAQSERHDARQAIKESRWQSNPERFARMLIGCIAMASVDLLIILLGLHGLPLKTDPLVFAAITGSFILVFLVTSITDQFAWLIMCVFLGVGMTVAFSTYARTYDHPKVSSFVALHAHRLPVTGFFVAETADAVYVGRPQPDWKAAGDLEFEHDSGALVRYTKESLSAIAIGPLVKESDAYWRSTRLALGLCRGSIRSPSGSVREPRCSSAAVRRLHARLAMLKEHELVANR